MPHITDLTQNTIWQGNNGERWIVKGSTTGEKEILVTLNKLEVEETVVVAPTEAIIK